MAFHVPSQIGSPPEGLPALRALEGPLSSMESLVANELGGLAKSFPTCATFVTLFPHGQVLESGGPGALLTIFHGLLPTRF